MKRALRPIAIALTATLMVACGEEQNGLTNIAEQQAHCAALDGQTYYSESLRVGGHTLEGVGYNYWELGFRDGEMIAFYTDVGEVVAYHCTEDGQVALSSSHMGPLSFSDDWQKLYFNPNQGDPITYRRHSPDRAEVSRCLQVRGNHYALVQDAVADDGPIPIETPFFNFGETTSVEFALGDGGTQMGYYSCQLGVLRVHRDLEDTDPMELRVQPDGGLLWQREDGEWELEKQDEGSPPSGEDPVACPDIYETVCGVIPSPVLCLSTPCAIGILTQFKNSCYADAEGAIVVNDIGCHGGNINQPYFPAEPLCEDAFEPVCGAAVVNDPCDQAPCPATVHATFQNACTVEVSAAPSFFEGECGDLEGTRVSSLEGACPAVWDPVCGLVPQPEIACVTEPCPSHEYRTFGNACAAGLSLASGVFEGECGALENTLTMGEPPVQLTSSLPSSDLVMYIENASIEDDLLSVDLGYTGCHIQHFNLYVSSEFNESDPVEVAFSFVPQKVTNCVPLFGTRFVYDLRPLKHAYQQAYQTESGEIAIPEIGTYRF